jgi:hypothetical protein
MPRKKNVTVGGYLYQKLGNFSGGLNTDDPVTIGDEDLAVATNVEYTNEGRVTVRKGARKRFASDFSASPVLGLSPYYKSDGTTKLIVASGTALYADNPHLAFEYDAQTDWQRDGVYTNLDVLSSPGDVKMFTPPQASFIGTPTYSTVWI